MVGGQFGRREGVLTQPYNLSQGGGTCTWSMHAAKPLHTSELRYYLRRVWERTFGDLHISRFILTKYKLLRSLGSMAEHEGDTLAPFVWSLPTMLELPLIASGVDLRVYVN